MAIMIAGFAAAMMVGIAIAKTFTLKVEKNAKVTDVSGVSKHETIVTSRGRAVYLLTGDGKRHPECLSAACLGAWPPVTVSTANKLSKAPGIAGKLGVWRHKVGKHVIDQATLAGHPLYTFAGDTANGAATGQGIKQAAHEVWFVITASAATAPGSPSPGGSGGVGGSGGAGGSASTSTSATTTSSSSSSGSSSSTTTQQWS